MNETLERRSRPRTTEADHAFDYVRRRLREANETSASLYTTCGYLQAHYDSACEVIVQHVTGGTVERARKMVELYRTRKGETP
jgi:hypothetical protein